MVRFLARVIARYPVVSGALMFAALMLGWRFGAHAIVDNYGFAGVAIGLGAIFALGFVLERVLPKPEEE